MRPPPWREAVLLALATVVCLAPFIEKPLHLDDPLFYWAAHQIVAHPLDPYGFTVNWYLRASPMAEITKNPPGACYFMALAATVLGWSAGALHAAFLLPAIATVVGTWALARRWSRRPLLAGLLVLVAPGFVVSATTLMSDVPMLALWVLATVLWVGGIDDDRPARLVAASVVAAACVLTKYPGAGVLPLLAVYAFARRGLGRWTAALLPALAAVAAYQWWSAALYGEAHLSNALAYAHAEGAGPSIHALPVALAFLGGSSLAALLALPWLVGTAALTAVGTAGVAAGVALGLGGRSWWTAGGGTDELVSIALHFGVFVAAGTAIVVLAARDLRTRRDAASLVLALWVLGILVFAGFVNWMSNVRSVLPALPAAAILAVRAVDRRFGDMPLPAGARIVPVVSLGVALWVAWGDYELARAQPAAANAIRARAAGRTGTLWFFGHWGFQPAMSAVGGVAVDFDTTVFNAGDVIAVPRNNTNVVPLPADMPVRTEGVEVPLRGGTTVSGRRGAGFYSSIWGPLPYRLEPAAPERYDVVHVLPTLG